MAGKILIVEDEAAIARFVELELRRYRMYTSTTLVSPT